MVGIALRRIHQVRLSLDVLAVEQTQHRLANQIVGLDVYIHQMQVAFPELLREYDGSVTEIAWDISDLSFEVDNQSIFTYVLALSPPGKWNVPEQITGKVYMENLP